jgi:Putative zinc-finger
MTHLEIERDDVIEQYVGRQLPPERARAFEEHVFSCDDCFDKVQALEQLRGGVRDAARRGDLPNELDAAAEAPSGGWLRPALALSACASLALAALTGWMYFSRIPALEDQIRQSATTLENERAIRREPTPSAPVADAPEPNVPLVMLVASRDVEKPLTADLPAGAKRLLLWIDLPSSAFKVFRLDILAPDGRTIATVDRLERNRNDALLASVPADRLPVGAVRIKLTGQDPSPAALVAEYRLDVVKR